MLRQAFILAGGLGTRMYPLTKDIPKPLVPLDAGPLLYYVLLGLKYHGVQHVILHVAYRGQQIMDYFGDGSSLGLQIDYVPAREPVGTAGALRLAAHLLEDDFIAMNSDELTNLDFKDLACFHRSHEATGTISLVQLADVTNLGVAVVENDRIARFVEKPKPEEAPSHLVSQGIYALNRRILDYIPKGGRPSLERDVWPKLAARGELYAYRAPTWTFWKPINSLGQLEEVRRELQAGRLQWLRHYQEAFERALQETEGQE